MISVITPTHNSQHLLETYKSLLAQTNQDWEWIVVWNGEAKNKEFGFPVSENRIKTRYLPEFFEGKGIGAIKLWSFMQGTGDYLLELDHDDLLAPTALEECVKAFEETGADFVYSNTCEFFANGNGHWFPDWKENGWRFRDATVDDRWYNECISFKPSAASLSLIYYAPNHFRVWRKEFYKKMGGHNPNYQLCDDHELLIRSFLHGKMHHIDKPLYLYRMGAQNTYSKNLGKISELTNQLYVENIEALILREAQIRNLSCYDLGAAFNNPPGWRSVDLQDAEFNCDLNKPWPWPDNSVLAFRAHDIIEHLPDKQHTMKELHRCLVPGGWALIQVPSSDGRGAFMDPTHCSYWNENSFWYYTRAEQAKYIRNTEQHFIESRLFTFFPSTWHEASKIPYVKAELRAIKGDMSEQPGFRRI